MGGMKYSLRTLVILTAIVPPLLAVFFVTTVWGFALVGPMWWVVSGPLAVAFYLATEHAVLMSERCKR